MSDTRFREQLRKLLGFVERSCAMFDQGHTDEAIRIATAVRVLLYDTRRSTSVLKHLDSKGIRLLSTAAGIPDMPKGRGLNVNGLVTIRAESTGIRYVAGHRERSSQRLLSVDNWWEEVVWILDGRPIARRHIVTAAANQDGGAHVDAELDVEYAELARDGAGGFLAYWNGSSSEPEPLRDAHLFSLRQIGYEILNSEELVSLTTPRD